MTGGEVDRRLQSWEAVVPGLVFPFLALWLGGSTWSARGIAAAANVAPFAVLALIAWRGWRWTPAIQGAATLAYLGVALAWIGTNWEWEPLAVLADHAALWTPVVAAGVAAIVFAVVAVVLRFTGGATPPAEGTV